MPSYNDNINITVHKMLIRYNKSKFYSIKNNYKLFISRTLKNTLDVALVIYLMISYKFIR